jgi:dihydroorotase-like cyclic amidohydrolase
VSLKVNNVSTNLLTSNTITPSLLPNKNAANGGADLTVVTTGERYTWNNLPTDSKAAANGGTTLSLVTTNEKYTWDSKAAGNHTHTTNIAIAASGDNN